MKTMSIPKAATVGAVMASMIVLACSPALADVTAAQPATQPATQSATAASVQLAGGDSIAVVILSDIGSRVSKQGDTFAVMTTDDYVVGGKLVLPKGSPGYGTITHLKPAGNWRANGELRFEINRLTAPDGSTFVTITNGDTADAQIHYERNGSDTMQWMLWGSLGAAHKKGDDMLVTAGSVIHLVVAGGRTATACRPGTAPAQLDLSQVSIPVPAPTPAPAAAVAAPAASPTAAAATK
jgi:hypothetical protein